jgi:acetyl-CoA synthetase
LQADLDWSVELARQPATFTAVRTKADEGAVLIYTSGTTGPPKGALIPHRALIGNLPGFVCSQNWFGFNPTTASRLTETPGSSTPSSSRRRAGEEGSVQQEAPALPEPDTQSVFWSPADWAWTGA